MFVPATDTLRFLDWPLGFKKLSVIRLTQCTNTTLNIVSHITHLLAAYHSNSIFTSHVKPTSWPSSPPVCWNLTNSRPYWVIHSLVSTWFGPRAVTEDHNSKLEGAHNWLENSISMVLAHYSSSMLFPSYKLMLILNNIWPTLLLTQFHCVDDYYC